MLTQNSPCFAALVRVMPLENTKGRPHRSRLLGRTDLLFRRRQGERGAEDRCVTVPQNSPRDGAATAISLCGLSRGNDPEAGCRDDPAVPISKRIRKPKSPLVQKPDPYG